MYNIYYIVIFFSIQLFIVMMLIEIYVFQGFSFLELKNQAFLSYLMNLVYMISRKLNGHSIQNDKSIGK